MDALWITLAAIGGFLLLIALLLFFGKAKLRIVCTQKPKIIASVFGIRFTLVSDEKKEKDADRDLSRCRNPKRALKKELRRQRKEAKKALKKKQKAALKAARKKEKKQQKKEFAATQPSPNLQENLSMITALVKKLYTVTQGKIRIRVKKMHIFVATGDAAKTAILYGTVVQSASYLLQFIQTYFAQIEREPGDMQIRADYLSAKSQIDIDIRFSVRLISALRIGIRMLLAYSNEKRIAQRKAKRRIKQKKTA